ncbi:ribosomal protein L20 [Acrasis kona]|uniref:Ribosomal protein L20 n=1 Tax=Acrasis kona TaxID=1008807 RepID=A0AAW2YIF7_9EUKA
MTRKQTILKLAKGYFGRSNRCYKLAANRVLHGLQHAYRIRRIKKRLMRRLWITNINAAAGEFGIKYSQFMRGLSLANVQLNRKMLAEIAKTEPLSMRSIAECSSSARKAYAPHYNEQYEIDDYFSEKLPEGYVDFEDIAPFAAKGVEGIPKNILEKLDKIQDTLGKLNITEAKEDEEYEAKLREEAKKKGIPDDDIYDNFTA